MEPSDLSNGNEILNDVLNRRLKNRERQRRYRERKRLKAGFGNADVTDSSQLQIVPLLTVGTDRTVEQVVTRVHCKRDWKKDARRAHAAKLEANSKAIPTSIQCLTIENHMRNGGALGTREAEELVNGEVLCKEFPSQSDGEQITAKRGRRNWKAEARCQK